MIANVLHCFLVNAIFVVTVFFSYYVLSAILVNKDDQCAEKS